MSFNHATSEPCGQAPGQHIIKKLQEDDFSTCLHVTEHHSNACDPTPSPVKDAESRTEHCSTETQTPRPTSTNNHQDVNASPLPPLRGAFPVNDAATGISVPSSNRRATSRDMRYTPYSRAPAKAIGPLPRIPPSTSQSPSVDNGFPLLISLETQLFNNRILAPVPAAIAAQLLPVAYGATLHPPIPYRVKAPAQGIDHVLIDLTFNPIAEFLWDVCRLQREAHLAAFRVFMDLGIRRPEHLDMVAEPLGTEKLCTQLENRLFWIHVLSIHLGLLKHRESMESDLLESNGEDDDGISM